VLSEKVIKGFSFEENVKLGKRDNSAFEIGLAD